MDRETIEQKNSINQPQPRRLESHMTLNFEQDLTKYGLNLRDCRMRFLQVFFCCLELIYLGLFSVLKRFLRF
jgi:hypothetical protein